MKDKEIAGCLLKVGNQYVCYNSYEADFFLGVEALSEIFPAQTAFDMQYNYKNVSPLCKKALIKYPTTKVIEKEHLDGF